MDIKILHLTKEDVPSLLDIKERAFKYDKLAQAGVPKDLTPEQDLERKEWRLKLTIERMSAPNNHYFKAVDDAGRIVAYSGWHGPKPAGYQPGARYNGRPSFLQEEAFEGIAARLAEAIREVLGGEGKDVWYLQSMSVDPDFQRQGIASKMMEDGLARLVDRDGGAKCFTESTPVAVRTYEKAGFEKRMSVPGLEDGYELVLLVRDVKSKLDRM